MNNEEKNIEEQGTAPESTPKTSWWAKLATGVKAGIIAAAALVVIIPIVLIIALGGNGNTGDGGNGDNGGNNGCSSEISYSVTVKDNEGNPIAGAVVSFYIKNNVLAAKDVKTDASGKATPSIKAKFVAVKVTDIPFGYEYSNLNVMQDLVDGELNITIQKLPYYTVKIIDQNNNAVVGAKVQMCSDNACFTFDNLTDENGETKTHRYESGYNYEAKILSLPNGYMVVGDENFDTYYDFEYDNTVTITVTKTAE